MKILVTGTPGVGKTTVAKQLAKNLGYQYINVAEFAIERGFTLRFDKTLKTHIVDVEKLKKALGKTLKEMDKVVLDTHLVDAIPSDCVDLVIVLRLHPRELESRLRARNYPKQKVMENVEAEILDYVLVRAVKKLGEDLIYELDTTGKTTANLVNEIMEALKKGKRKCGTIDWINVLEREGLIEKYLVSKNQ
ncbi:MAG: adenylate kinase family protein [Thermoproteales archaeon]|nr:adenylate kinase family protein [Thermoproteales archaeon]